MIDVRTYYFSSKFRLKIIFLQLTFFVTFYTRIIYQLFQLFLLCPSIAKYKRTYPNWGVCMIAFVNSRKEKERLLKNKALQNKMESSTSKLFTKSFYITRNGNENFRNISKVNNDNGNIIFSDFFKGTRLCV